MKDLEKIAARIVQSSGQVRTAGIVEFKRDQGPIRRDIRAQGFKWTPDTLKSLAKILWAVERSHSYGIAALRLFSKMPSSEFSPDGLLGGRGYIQQVKDMRSEMSKAVEVLSSFSDTVYDEINAPHWAAVKDEGSDEIVAKAEEAKTDPSGYVDDQFKQQVPDQNYDSSESEEPETLENPSPEDLNPVVEEEEEPEEEEDGTRLSSDLQYRNTIGKILDRYIRKTADSSIPTETLSGPRVEHIGPGESEEGFASDDPAGEGFGSNSNNYIYEGADAQPGDGYSNPTRGDSSIFKEAFNKIGYSWLPGSTNEKLMNYYALGLTKEDADWMRANNEPDLPDSMKRKTDSVLYDPIWNSIKKELGR